MAALGGFGGGNWFEESAEVEVAPDPRGVNPEIST
jgi:hypothetical protein